MFPHCTDTLSRLRGLGLTLLCLLALAGCSASPPQPHSPPTAVPTQGNADAATTPAAADPPEAVAAYERATQMMSAGDSAGAERAFRQLADQYPSYAGPLINLAILYAKTNRTSDAELALKEALQRNPNNAPAHNQLGMLYRKAGRFKEADEAYQQALTIDPNYALAHLNRGVLYDLYLEEPQRALESFERYLQLEPNPQPQVRNWVKELRTRLGIREPPPAETAPAAAAPQNAPETGASP